MTEQDERNIQTVRLMYAGEAKERTLIAPDIVWHVPGHNPVSGDYRGFEAYTQTMPGRMAPLSRWDFALDDVMVNGDTVLATFHVQGERKGRQIAMRGAHVMRLNPTGQIVEGWGFADDQNALDQFFSA